MKLISKLFTITATLLLFLTIVTTATASPLETASKVQQRQPQTPCIEREPALDGQPQVVACVDETGIVHRMQVPAGMSTATLVGRRNKGTQTLWAQTQAEIETQALPGGNFWQCYDDGGPACYNTLNAVQMIDENEGWAVGDGGIILHYKNGGWKKMPSPTLEGNLYSISMLSATDGWVVGYDFDLQEALTLHWDGSIWQKVSNPAESVIESVSMLSSDNGWAVGWGDYDFERQVWYSTILHWNGQEWQIADTPDGNFLRGIDMVSATNGWAVGGGSDDGDHALIFRWNGSVWQPVTSPTTDPLLAVSMVSATNGWAVGANGVILHWDGNSWQSVNSPVDRALSTISMVSANDGWAMGLFDIVHWNGTTWHSVSNPTTLNPRAVWMISGTDGWVVGVPGAIHRWNGSEWAEVITPPEYSLNAVSMVSATDGWIGGWDAGHGGGFFLRWNGTTWQPVNSPTTGTPLAIDMLSASNGWTVSWDPETNTSQILHWNGAVWQIVTNPTPTKRLTSLSMLSATDGWIAGYEGVALHWNGSNWQVKSTGLPADYKIDAISMVSANDGWAVSYTIKPDFYPLPVINRWNGTTWSSLEVEFENRLFGIGLVSPTDVWFVGDMSNIFHWTGSQLQAVSNPTQQTLVSIDMLSSNDGWAVGDHIGISFSEGVIAHWNGSVWQQFQSPTGRGLASVSMVSPTDGWAVGATAILRFHPISTGSISAAGGSLISPSGDTTFTFSNGTFPSTTTVTFTAQPSLPHRSASLIDIGHNFELSAIINGTGQPAQPAQPYTIVIQYIDAENNPVVMENTLALYFWNGSEWEKEPTSVVDTASNTVTASPSHFSEWAVLGESRTVFLPLILKG